MLEIKVKYFKNENEVTTNDQLYFSRWRQAIISATNGIDFQRRHTKQRSDFDLVLFSIDLSFIIL